MWYNTIKTTILLASLSGLLMLIGGLIGGDNGIIMAFIFSLIINGFTYFFSDKLVLRMYNAKPLDKDKYSQVYEIVSELTHQENIPMPKLWLVNTDMANAFATGRNPKNASVAVTTGILSLLDKEELRGVLAHELSHVKNRDILIGTIAATIASTIGMMANLMRNMAIFSSFGGNSSDKNRANPIALLIVSIIMPIAATLIQLAISRAREYKADESGADLCKDPLALASALEKLSNNVKVNPLNTSDAAKSATEPLFIVKPFTSHGFASLFSTHPPIQARIAKLRQMYENMTDKPV